MLRSILPWCLGTLLIALSASADPCDEAYPYTYDFDFQCETSEGVCSLSNAIAAKVYNWAGAPDGCATVVWTFGDGSAPVTANGAETVQHTYSAAGRYTIQASVRTPNFTQSYERSRAVQVAAGVLKWSGKTVQEGKAAEITVTRSNTSGAVSLPWSVQDDLGATPTEILPPSGTVTFAPGQAVAVLQFSMVNDDVFTANRQYKVVAGQVTNNFIIGSPYVMVDIQDDDFSTIRFAEMPIRVSEDAGVAVVTLTRTGGLNGRVSTDYFVDALSSDPRIVETFGTLVFEPGQASRSFNVPIIHDGVFTGPTSAAIRLSQPTGGARLETSSATLTVDDNDEGGVVITARELAVPEGDAGWRLVALQFNSTRPLHGELLVNTTDGTAKRGTDYSQQGSTIYFNSGTAATALFRIRGDEEPEPDKTFTITLTRYWGMEVPLPGPFTVTIVNDDTSFTPAQFRVRRGHTQQATLVVGGTSDTPLVVPLTSSRPELLRVPASVTLPAGANRVSFDMEGLEVGTTIRVTANLPAERGGPQKIIGHVYEPQGVTFDPATVNAYAGQEVPVKIVIEGGSNMFDLPLMIRDAQIASAPGAVTILPDGSGAFTVKALKTGTTRIEVKKPGSLNDYAMLEIVVAEAPETPAIASVSPATGPAAGGAAFVAPGSHLTGDCTLAFGGVPVRGTTLAADGTLQGITPSHPVGTVDVVLSCGATTFVLTDAFTYLESPPALSSIAPTFGSLSGGTLVRAAGTNFQSGCWMFFDGVPATSVEVESTTSLIASSPARASSGLVATSIRCGDHETTLAASYAYSSAAEPAASIISVEPLIGAPGESVTITGSRFRTDDGIDFDGTPATVLRNRPDEHVVRIPELPLGTSSITLTDRAGRITTTGPIFTIVEPLPPQVTSVSPASTLPGSEVTLRGRGFRPGYSFSIGGQPAETLSLRFDEVAVRLGHAIAAGTYPVQVLNASGKVAAIGASINVRGGALRVRDVVPGCGTTDGGAAVLITGEGFADGATVTFNGIPAADVVFVDARQLRATTPPNVTGTATVEVQNPDGDAATASRFTYFSPFDPDGGCGNDTRSRSVRH